MSKRKILIIVLAVLIIALITVVLILLFGKKPLPDEFSDYTLNDFKSAYNETLDDDENIGDTTTFIASENVDNETYTFENGTRIDCSIIKDNDLLGSVTLTCPFPNESNIEEFISNTTNAVIISTGGNRDEAGTILEETNFFNSSLWNDGYEGVYSYDNIIYQFNYNDHEASFMIFMGYR